MSGTDNVYGTTRAGQLGVEIKDLKDGYSSLGICRVLSGTTAKTRWAKGDAGSALVYAATRCYAKSGTDSAYAAIPVGGPEVHVGRGIEWKSPTWLGWYLAMLTGIARYHPVWFLIGYAATRKVHELFGLDNVHCGALMQVLVSPYAMPGTPYLGNGIRYIPFAPAMASITCITAH
eukprot:1707823-Rhodomonas_salina.2